MRRRSLPDDAPGRRDINAAARVLRPYAPRTPLIRSVSLPGEVFLKLETLSPTGSFKWRGVLYRMLNLRRAELARGVVTASTGNHGYAVAWAAARLGTNATVVVPTGTPRFKQERIQRVGGDVLVRGKTWNDSLLVARAISREDGSTPIEDGEDPVLMAGTATLGLEVLRQLPEVDVIVAPVGGGNLIAALACALDAEGHRATLIGVQSRSARGAFDSWKQGRIVSRPVRTIAGGIATAAPVPFSFDIMQRRVDEMHLVSDEDLLRASGELMMREGVVVEPSGAAPWAAIDALRLRKHDRVVLVATGRSVEPALAAKAVRTAR